MFNINRLLRSRPQTDNADQAPAQDRPSRQPSPAQGLLSPLLARPRRRESRSAADTSTPRNAAQGRFSRSPLHPSSQPEALAGASSAPPRSIEHDIDDWLAQSLPMAERIPTGYNLHDGSRDTSRDVLQSAAEAIRRAATRRSTELLVDGLPATRLPDAIGRLDALQKLMLLYTGVQSLPDSLGQLSQLRHLQISGAQELKNTATLVDAPVQSQNPSIDDGPLGRIARRPWAHAGSAQPRARWRALCASAGQHR